MGLEFQDLLDKRSGLEYLETVLQTLRNRLKEIDDPDVLKSLHKKALHAGSLEQFTVVQESKEP